MNELLALMAALVIHELGHLAAAKILGVPLVRFRLSPMGGVMSFDFSHSTYGREAAVHLAGPFAGILSAAVGWFVLRDFFFTGISVTLACVNLLPVIGLDGGGMLSCLLNRFLTPEQAWRISENCSVGGILLLWTAVLWIELRVTANMGLLAFAVFLLLNQTKRPEDP
ncbi:MAG: hypothetical protein IJ037_03925 [Clostridia bacterium]|nr:hypothetical protein [Clostridia bacterium]MBQ8513536.1 hypothetical protein [Clostridia bacterium]